MASRFACISALLLLSAVAYSQAGSNEGPLEQLVKQLNDFAQSTAKQVKEAVHVPDEIEKDKLYQQIKTSVQKTLDQVSETVKKYEKDGGKALADDVKANIEKVTKQLNETVKQLKDKDTQAKLDKIYDSSLQAAKKISEQTQELAKSLGFYNLIPESVQKAAHEAYEDTQKLIQKTQQKVGELIEESKKGGKH